jgi:hypothetical protein
LDYGNVHTSTGCTFTGYIAAVRTYNETIPEVFLDFGTLTLPDGKTFTGDFSIQFSEGSILSYSIIPQNAQNLFTDQPHVFFGRISSLG